jgi:uncharacterized phage-associated protein
MTTALAVANAFIRLANEKAQPISNMKLQKLVYFAQGFHAAANNGAPLFNDEIEAWKYGPVIPDLYHKFKIYFAGPIPAGHPFEAQEELAPDQQALVKWVYENLGQYSAIRLSDFSHVAGSPWDKVYNGPGPTGRAIPVEGMIDYFKGLLKPRPAPAAA